MKILAEKLNQDEFRNYVAKYDFGSIKPDSLVVHHTWSPKKKDWSGKPSLYGIKNYYESKGWSAGPHLFISDDAIWLFTPMSDVGIHAGAGNATWKRLGRTYTGFRGPVGSRLAGYSIGIEVVGDYDEERWSGKTKSNALAAIRILKKKLNIENDNITFHRDWSSKTCPGSAITKEWLFKELAKKDAEGSRTKQNLSVLSEWARDGWAWQLENDFDRYVSPHQKVEAEWVFAIMHKYHDKFNSSKKK